jgi:predicted DNA-binding transcriptional regulator AlpA
MERLMTAKEVAEWLAVKPQWVYAHTKGTRRPMIPHIPFPCEKETMYRYRKEDIEAWLEQLSQS